QLLGALGGRGGIRAATALPWRSWRSWRSFFIMPGSCPRERQLLSALLAVILRHAGELTSGATAPLGGLELVLDGNRPPARSPQLPPAALMPYSSTAAAAATFRLSTPGAIGTVTR